MLSLQALNAHTKRTASALTLLWRRRAAVLALRCAVAPMDPMTISPGLLRSHRFARAVLQTAKEGEETLFYEALEL